MLTYRHLLAVAVGVLVASAWPLPAWADDTIGGVDCASQPRPGCEVTAGTRGDGGRDPKPQSGSGGVCRDKAGRKAPCHDPNAGYMASDGCYYRPADIDPATEAAMGGSPQGRGGWYWRTCRGDLDGSANSMMLVWLENPPAISPEILARQAASRLVLPAVQVRSSPSGEKLVRLPTWLWVSSSSWGSRSATASVPGITVTARAHATRASWVMGDGTTVVCRGPGTPWRSGTNPRAQSPDCGHTYTRSSAGQPQSSYPVSVTVTWAISWSGGGQSGTLPALSTTGTARFRVAESQTLVSR